MPGNTTVDTAAIVTIAHTPTTTIYESHSADITPVDPGRLQDGTEPVTHKRRARGRSSSVVSKKQRTGIGADATAGKSRVRGGSVPVPRRRQARGRSSNAFTAANPSANQVDVASTTIPPVTAGSDQHQAPLVPTAHGPDLVATPPDMPDPYFPKWSKVLPGDPIVELNKLMQFTGKREVIDVAEGKPYDTFTLFFPENIYSILVEETNKYAMKVINSKRPLQQFSRYHEWYDVTEPEMKAFIAIEIAMGLVRKTTIESYFNDSFFLTSTPGFRQIFTSRRFQMIRMALHFADNDLDIGQDKLFKIRPLLDLVENTYTLYYTPGKELSIDESMKKFKGRCFAKQYMPNKPSAKWGLKVFSMCDSKTGYLLKFDVYTGKSETLPDVAGGVGSKVVQSLSSDFMDKGHDIYVDNWYTSVPLLEDLRTRNTGACGTVRNIRKGLPKEMKKVKPKKGAKPEFWKNGDNTMLACVWMDTGKVNMLSTIGDTSITQKNSQTKRNIICRKIAT